MKKIFVVISFIAGIAFIIAHIAGLNYYQKEEFDTFFIYDERFGNVELIDRYFEYGGTVVSFGKNFDCVIDRCASWIDDKCVLYNVLCSMKPTTNIDFSQIGEIEEMEEIMVYPIGECPYEVKTIKIGNETFETCEEKSII